MPTDNGYSNQKKLGTAQFETVHNLGSDTYGKVVAQKAVFNKQTSIEITSVTPVEDRGTLVSYIIGLPGHTAYKGDILRLLSEPLKNFELEIIEVIDANTLRVLAATPQAPAIGSDAAVLGWVTAKLGEDGSTSVTIDSAPTQYNYNGNPQVVEQDTTNPANNRAMPNLNFILKDGVQVPVTKTTGVPSNTVAIPVEIVGAEGQDINITAGDINIQTTDMGLNFDSMRIGDGSGNYIGVNADAEAQVTDAKTLTELETLNTVDFATETTLDGVKTAVEAIDVSSLATEVTLDAVKVAVEALDTTALATESTLEAVKVAVESIDNTGLATETTLEGVKTAVEALDTTALATEATLENVGLDVASISAKLPDSLGAKTGAGSLSIVPASDSGLATSANQSLAIMELSEIHQEVLTRTFTPKQYDEVELSYTGDNLTGVIYKLATVTVMTLTLSYTGANLTGVVKS